MAMAPADDPKICVLVILDHPTGESYYGGRIAAPVGGRIVEDILTYLDVERKYTKKDLEMMEEEIEVPNVCGSSTVQANSMLAQHGFITRIEGEVEDSVVEKQLPSKNWKTYWLCKCDCGKYCKKYGNDLISGKATNCGCISKKNLSDAGKKR